MKKQYERPELIEEIVEIEDVIAASGVKNGGAVSSSSISQSIKDLLTLKQDYANLKKRDKLEKIAVEEIKINDILIVKKGEKVPVDGIIMDGNAYLNTSSITGESDIKEANVGDLVYSGYLNTGDIFSLKATKTYENSMINKILELVETASNRKAKTETTVSKLSRYYTPVILVLSFLTYLLLPLLFRY